MTPFLALHWPYQTIVAADHPDGWAQARPSGHPGLGRYPIPDRHTVAVTYRTRDGQLAERIPLDHQRVRQALRLAEQYTLHDHTEDTHGR